ncbi:hypothetical protein BDM02DRAFT_1974009 [Thelephora ganbajun]|uniref:Uncharacterized protein n=1 Tax=Thelephora ganbajun TaxID=370292 RepID=A0ACB6YZ24_THEGA|nr:hypothetical protein BDM02DRAFT_1974009 [Thelephora ganbajun]
MGEKEGETKGMKRKETVNNAGVGHLRATRLRSRPSSDSTFIGSLGGKTTGGTPVLFAEFMLLMLLVRRLEDGVWDGVDGDVADGESIIIITACLRLAPAERDPTWFGMLENVRGPGALSVGKGSMFEVAGGVGDSFLRFPSKRSVEWDGGRRGLDEGEGEEGWVGRCIADRSGGEFGVASPPIIWEH